MVQLKQWLEAQKTPEAPKQEGIKTPEAATKQEVMTVKKKLETNMVRLKQWLKETPEATKQEVITVKKKLETNMVRLKQWLKETPEATKQEVITVKKKLKTNMVRLRQWLEEEVMTVRDTDRKDLERKSLVELKQLINTALLNHEFFSCITTHVPDETPSASTTTVETPSASTTTVETPNPSATTTICTTVETPNPSASTTTVEETPSASTTTVEETSTPSATTTIVKETPTPILATPTPETETSVEKKTQTNVLSEEKVEIVEAKVEIVEAPDKVSIYGVTLLLDEGSDVILLKFLRARNFKVMEAFNMIKKTVHWRRTFGVDALLDEDLGLGNDLEEVFLIHGLDIEGHPVCYNAYGEFQNKELYKKIFFDKEKRQDFIRWWIQFFEKSIRRTLNFSPGGISTVVQITDFKNSPGFGKWELLQAANQAVQLLQDNYPEFVAKHVCINVPWWYFALHKMINLFSTERTKSKFVVAGPSKSAETLFKYITPEQVPVRYGGLSKEGGMEFSSTDPVQRITIHPGAKHTIEFPASKACVLVWEVRVLGWEVNYGEDFVPTAKDGYRVCVRKTKMIRSSTDEHVMCNSFKIGEPGKIEITICNSTIKKKKILFRSKVK